jgi:antitoxin MazE
MATLIKIGNSKGIRIPKPLVEQAQLENRELSLEVTQEGLLIKPSKQSRQDWPEKIRLSLEKNGQSEKLDDDWLDAKLTEEYDWEW